MAGTACQKCGGTEQLHLWGERRVICGRCLKALEQEMGGAVPREELVELAPGQQVTFPCAMCKAGVAPGGSAIQGANVCDACAATLRKQPLPVWLKIGAAFLIIMTLGSLANGWRYFQAEGHLIRGGRALDAEQWEEASAQLALVLAIAPRCRRAVLGKMESDLRRGDFQAAFQLANVQGNREFDRGPQFDRTMGLLEGADQALRAVDRGSKRMEADEAAAALKAFEQARRLYPQLPNIDLAILNAKAAAAFDAGDYPGFLAAAAELAQRAPEAPMVAAQHASALAAMYADTGEADYRTEAEAQLHRAEQLSRTEEQRTAHREYAERIRHRLESREIIDKSEYDRRFRSAQGGGAGEAAGETGAPRADGG